MSVFPPHGDVDVEILNDVVILTIDRDDGISLSVTLRKEEFKKLVEHFENMLRLKRIIYP
ncbi:MAG: hypothetical protein DRN91_06545 [Candidatus Alkanophagales archaeon]|nr:MAG: hypothetical protein DRN91_06545 [Candidatus Alkanophagales archaeon]